MNRYECYLCKNQDDCIEVKSQAVRDVSIRCGLTCHSDFQSELEKVLDELVKFFTIGWFSKSKTVPRDVLLGKLEELRQKAGEQ